MKSRNIILLLILSTVLSGCSAFYYGDDNANSHIKSKKSMASFSHLNDPIVITMPVWNYKWLFGNKNTYPMTILEGDIFVVYDWENETIHDWAFFEGEHGLSNWRAVEMGNPVKYYDAGQFSRLIGCLNPQDGKISVYSNPFHGTFSNLNNNMKNKSEYGIIITHSYENGYNIDNINAFSTKDNTVNKDTLKIKISSGAGNQSTPVPDEDGNFWYGYAYDGKSWASKIDLKNNIKTEYLICDLDMSDPYEDIFVMKLVWKDYVFLADTSGESYGKLLIKHKDNMDLPAEYVDFPKVEKEGGTFIGRGMILNDEPYFLFRTDKIDVDVLYKYDVLSKEFIYENEIHFDYTETIYTRGSRLYMICSRRIENFKCTYYDIDTKKMGSVKALTFDEIVGGKK